MPIADREPFDSTGILRDEKSGRYERTLLQALAKQFPNVDSALAEIARLSAVLTLPKGTVHVISDIHGEDKKLRHVINDSSKTRCRRTSLLNF